MRHRLFIWTLEGLGALIAVLLLGIGALAVRLYQGPLELDSLTPFLVSYLGDEVAPLHPAIARTQLRWVPQGATIELAAADVRLNDDRGRTVLSLDEGDAAFSFSELISMQAAPRQLILSAPRAALVRTAGGVLGLGVQENGQPILVLSDPAESDADIRPPPADRGRRRDLFRHLGDDLAGRGSYGDPLRRLDRVLVRDPDLRLHDALGGRDWRLRGTFSLSRYRNFIDMGGTAVLTSGSLTARLQMQANYQRADEVLQVSLRTDPIDPSAWVPAFQALPPILSEIRLPVAGKFSGELHLPSGDLGQAVASLTLGPGTLADARLNGGSVDIAGGDVEAVYSAEQQALNLTKLSLVFGGVTATATGTIQQVPRDLLRRDLAADGQPWPMSGDLGLSPLAVERLIELWPAGVGRNAREWISANLSKGRVDSFSLHGTAGLKPAGLVVEAPDFKARMGLSGFTLDYLHGMPKLDDVGATVDMAPDSLNFAITGGHALGLAVTGGTVLIDRLQGLQIERMTIDIGIKGPAADVVTLIGDPPLGYAKRVGLSAGRIAGTLDGKLHFQFPLKKDLSVAEVAYGATANLHGLSLRNAALGRDLSQGELALTLGQGALKLAGAARLADVPVRLEWAQRLADGGLPELMEVKAQAAIDDAGRRRLGFGLLPDNVKGPVGAQIVYDDLDGHQARAHIDLDLGEAALSVPLVQWRKPAGPAAEASFDLLLQNGHITRIDKLKFTAPGASAAGSLGFDGAGGIESVDVVRAHIAGSDASGSVSRQGGGPWIVRLSGGTLDISALVKARGGPETPHKAEAARKPTPYDVQLRAGRLILGPERVLDGVALSAVADKAGLASVSLTSRFDRKGQPDGRFDLRLDPPERGGQLVGQADDFGALLRVLGVSEHIIGGTFRIDGSGVMSNGLRVYQGHAHATEYRLVNAPFFARLFSVASFQSMGSLLAGQGMPFTAFDADFTYSDDRLGVKDGRAYGGAIGINAGGWVDFGAAVLDLEGTLVPANFLNSALSNVPILGSLLGGKGQGLFAVNYRLTGPIGEPKITVNPLSAIAPGVLRKLFPAPGK